MNDEQQILKTRLSFCGYCGGCGFVLMNLPLYKKETSPTYITCWQCKGTDLRRDWRSVGRYTKYKLKQNNRSFKSRAINNI